MTCGDPGGDALRTLLQRSHLITPGDLSELIAEAAAKLGALDCAVYLVDYDQVLLVPLAGTVEREPVHVDASLPGRAFSEVAPYQSAADGVRTLWLPVVDGTERLGVLQLVFPNGHQLDDDTVADCRHFASLIALMVLSKSKYGDAIEWTRRRLPLAVAAELQWTQLPPLTFATPQVAITGVLVPAHEVAGDSFDYAVDGDVASVAVIDAMGHGLEATLLSAVAIAAMRNARRAGLELTDIARSVDKHLSAHFGIDRFVTAVLGELCLSTGVWRWVNAGHPPPMVIRDGRVVKALTAQVGPPLGLGWTIPTVAEERLQPGDRLLLHSDGVTEARNAAGEFFGTERLVDFVTRQAADGRPAPETLRRLNLAILAHQGGDLQDDATTVLVEWLGDQPKRLDPSP